MCEIAGMRRGADYLASLRDGRAVFLDGRRVDDVTAHPAFAESSRRIAERYDAAREAPDVTTCVDPASGKRIGAMWLIPRSAEDLGRRRAVHRFWAEGSYGLMGRTPDHVASVLTAFAGWRQLFDRGGPQFGDNAVRFHAKACAVGPTDRIRGARMNTPGNGGPTSPSIRTDCSNDSRCAP